MDRWIETNPGGVILTITLDAESPFRTDDWTRWNNWKSTYTEYLAAIYPHFCAEEICCPESGITLRLYRFPAEDY